MHSNTPRRRAAALFTAAALCAGPALASAGDPPSAGAAFRPPVPGAADPRIPHEKYTLPNGLEVILAPDRRVPVVAVNLWYHVGSGSETYGRSGFAHLFEHMVFQGSKHVGSDRHFEILRKLGGDAVNGSTTEDRTNYFQVVPSNQLEAALWLESDRMGYLLDPSTFTQQSLNNQIDVVRNERRQNYDNRPYGKALFALGAALYPEGHPYRYLVIGKHEDLTAASMEDVKSFFKTWYVPANATLTLVGDFEPAAAKQAVEKWLGTFPRSVRPRVVPVPAPRIRATETVVTDDSFAKLRQVTFAWHSPANLAEGDAELDIAADVLARDGVGWLSRALVYDRPLAQSVSAAQSGSGFSGELTVTVTLRSDASLDEVKRLVAAEVARLTTELVPPAAIARYAASTEAALVRRLESVLGRAETLQYYNHYTGDPDRISWDLDRYRKTTPERIRAIAAQYLRPDRMVTVITLPAQPTRTGAGALQGGSK
jgi:predicted Zn-dependent peptidase